MPEFKFSLPPITALNDDQQLAYDPKSSMFVTGGPGSGKTVVTIFRFLRAVLEKKKIILFTYNRTLMYSIKGTLRDRSEELFGSFDKESIDIVVEEQLSTFFKWHKDNIVYYNPLSGAEEVADNFKSYVEIHGQFVEMFFDEGQDLPRTVYGNAFILSKTVSVGADRAQNYRGYYSDDEVEDVINDELNAQQPTDWQYLASNFRNTKEIFDLAKKFVPRDPRVQRMESRLLRRGNNPEIQIGLNVGQQLNIVKTIVEANLNSNIGILVHFPTEITTIRMFLETIGYSCRPNADPAKSYSYYYNKMSINDEKYMKDKLSTPFITTFESCKGLEFDVVIMPFFDSSDVATTKKNDEGRFWATPNHYYVAVTRAKNDLFILCNNKPMALSFYTAPAALDADDDLPF